MGEPLFVDPHELRNTAEDLHTLAADTARKMSEYKADLAREGECWGGDEPGKMFAESYVPAAEENMTGFENLVASIEATGENLRSTAQSFESWDRDAATQVRNSLPGASDPRLPGTHLAQPDHASEPEQRAPGPQPAQRHLEPSSFSSPVKDDIGANTPEPVADTPRDSSAEPSSAGGNSGRSLRNAGPNDVGPEKTASTDASARTPARDRPRIQSSPPTSISPTSEKPPATSGISPRVADRKTPPVAAPSTRSPGGRNSSVYPPPVNSSSPWSKVGAAIPPEQQVPPRALRSQRPAASAPPPRPEQGEAAPRKPQPATTDEAMQIIDAMAARHNLKVTGFESSGTGVRAAQEIADAVDAVLAEYVLTLHGIAVADNDGDLSRYEDRGQAAEQWIVLDRRAVADSDPLPDDDRTPIRPEADHLPIYTTMLREFGHLVDLAGGFRARRTAQRALITEYLRVTGAEGRTLAQVTEGYRHWRAQLGEYCFHHGALDPGRALSEGFALVEQGGDRASGPAKVLHRLLVALASPEKR